MQEVEEECSSGTSPPETRSKDNIIFSESYPATSSNFISPRAAADPNPCASTDWTQTATGSSDFHQITNEIGDDIADNCTTEGGESIAWGQPPDWLWPPPPPKKQRDKCFNDSYCKANNNSSHGSHHRYPNSAPPHSKDCPPPPHTCGSSTNSLSAVSAASRLALPPQARQRRSSSISRSSYRSRVNSEQIPEEFMLAASPLSILPKESSRPGRVFSAKSKLSQLKKKSKESASSLKGILKNLCSRCHPL